MLVHDRWAAHFKCEAIQHQICLAHLLRDLNYIAQIHKDACSKSLKSVLKQGDLLK
ncbi:hypothetical protein ADIARSV_3258 [Arcticibacter svalbardensis MN12-7]|uniref:Transposase n=1 Tax=Arcticibacter svalbardensis MN12-7 TaxID=1150600 RepID=R9GPS9_9SPHI|nr:hypothetical protein ADIARSV_3258 [Arcticibacter svalbardensis MN12-7]